LKKLPSESSAGSLSAVAGRGIGSQSGGFVFAVSAALAVIPCNQVG